MPTFRVFVLDYGRKTIASPVVDCNSNEAALEAAEEMLVGTAAWAIIWQGTRVVGSVSRSRAAVDITAGDDDFSLRAMRASHGHAAAWRSSDERMSIKLDAEERT